MKKITLSSITNQIIIDIRPQLDFQVGHLQDSLNLTPKNFSKFAANFLTVDQPIVFVIDDESNDLQKIEELIQAIGFKHASDYILITDISKDRLTLTPTVSAAEFLNIKDDYILLDVRNPSEITRPAPKTNLINIPLEDLTKDYASLESKKTIYTLCGSGNRGTTAASYLESKGFKAVVIEGGMKAIQQEQ